MSDLPTVLQCECGALSRHGTARCPVCGRELVRTRAVAGLLAGKWRLERQLGHGAMGVVYLATDVSLGRQVAVKRLHPTFGKDPTLVARILREARVLARLDHPQLVPIYAVEVEQGLPMLVMKFIEGQPLSALLHERTKLPLAEIAPMVAQLCEGLDFLHRKGFVHRDLKPSNVMIQPDGRIVLLDFGLAREMSDDGQRLTSPGTALGTAFYMSPEQVEDQPLDQRSDVYGLAVMVWQLLTGKLPFKGSVAVAMMQRLVVEPQFASDVEPSVPREVSQVLHKALSRAREARHFDSRSFAAAFAGAAKGTGGPATQLDETARNLK